MAQEWEGAARCRLETAGPQRNCSGTGLLVYQYAKAGVTVNVFLCEYVGWSHYIAKHKEVPTGKESSPKLHVVLPPGTMNTRSSRD